MLTNGWTQPWRSAIGLVDVECRDLLVVLTERVRKALENSWRRVRPSESS